MIHDPSNPFLPVRPVSLPTSLPFPSRALVSLVSAPPVPDMSMDTSVATVFATLDRSLRPDYVSTTRLLA